MSRSNDRGGISTAAATWLRLGLLGAAVAVASCSDDGAEGYSRAHRAGFVRDCTSGSANRATCGCFYDRLAAEVPFERFQDVDEQVRGPAADLPPDLAAMAATCAAEHQAADGG
jgi:hypothetical protein